MNAKQAKQINLVKFLARLGYQPVRTQAQNVWYKSPFREERSPSFKIDANKQYWYDFGLGEGGTIIDFVSRLNKTTNISEVLAFIERNTNSLEQFYIKNVNDSIKSVFSFHKQKESNGRELDVLPVIDDWMWSYLNQRGISERYTEHLKQASIISPNMTYRVLAFENDKGGYEFNNRYHRSCNSKALTTIRVDEAMPIFVFEGFFDYLSFWELAKKDGSEALNFLKKSNFLVLNSVSLTKQGIEALKPYSDIRLFLDNDDAGASASQEIMSAFPMAKDHSHLYKGHKDLNEFLVKADESSFVGFLSRCAIVLTKTNVLSRNGNLAFTPEGRKSSGAILSNLAPQSKPPVEQEIVKPKRNRGLCR